MRSNRWTVATLLILAAGATASAKAQNPTRPADSAAANRAALEQQVRERIAEVTRERLGATDEQMAKLQQTNQKFDAQRRALVDQERETRVALRKATMRGDAASQTEIGPLLDRVNNLQRQRLDIQDAEQKELAGYLTPVQRSKYFALEQQVRQKVNQMRQAQAQADGGGRAGRGARAGQLGRGRGVIRPPKPQ